VQGQGLIFSFFLGLVFLDSGSVFLARIGLVSVNKIVMLADEKLPCRNVFMAKNDMGAQKELEKTGPVKAQASGRRIGGMRALARANWGGRGPVGFIAG
jgi:hypothetical protein